MFETVWKHDGWGIGIISASAAALAHDDPLPAVQWLSIARAHTFVADPFLIHERGTTYCFFEELPYSTNRGVISYIALREQGDRPYVSSLAFAERHHLSYPFLLRHDGEILCIPEAAESGCITVYSAECFPDRWYRKKTLLEFPGVDSTVFRHENRWWLFCTNGRHAWNSELYAFYADDLFGRWRAHDANPILADASSARPGGRPFTIHGRLFRPAQNCLLRYGGSLAIAEILELTTRRYVQRIVSALVPQGDGPYPDGLHTACAEDNLIAVDGNRFRFEPRQALRVVAGKARALLSSQP